MPRIQRRIKQRVQVEWTDTERDHLLRGWSFVPDAFGPPGPLCADHDMDLMRRAWRALRRELLSAWIAEHPGTRPWAWWVFDSPERRRRVDGKPHPFDDQDRQEHVERVAANPGTATDYRDEAYQLSWGTPRCLLPQFDAGAEYEEEADYLGRLGLLSAAEFEFSPGVVPVVCGTSERRT